MEIQKGFGSDNHASVHSTIMQSILDCNLNHAPSYGTDSLTEKALLTLQQHFGENCEAYFVFNGTAANVLALATLVSSYHTVLCSDVAHINVDECGAPEKMIGCKLQPIATTDGKLSVESLRRHLIRRGDQHFSQAKAISITQPTELGTVYSLEEIAAICQFAKQNKLRVHMDGARLVNAAYFLKCTLQQMTSDLGVDVVSFGGTKNGLMFGEAVVLLNSEIKNDFKFLRKQMMQLPSKTRFIAAQFQAWLGTDLHREIAQKVHGLALQLRDLLLQEPSIKVTQEVQSNAVFCIFPKPIIKKLRQSRFFYIWNEETFEARLMISHDTTSKEITDFAQLALDLCRIDRIDEKNR